MAKISKKQERRYASTTISGDALGTRSFRKADVQSAFDAWARVRVGARRRWLEHGDAVRGKAVFEKRCTGCHAMDVDREGPRLAGVFGRKAGSIGGLHYSAG